MLIAYSFAITKLLTTKSYKNASYIHMYIYNNSEQGIPFIT